MKEHLLVESDKDNLENLSESDGQRKGDSILSRMLKTSPKQHEELKKKNKKGGPDANQDHPNTQANTALGN